MIHSQSIMSHTRSVISPMDVILSETAKDQAMVH